MAWCMSGMRNKNKMYLEDVGYDSYHIYQRQKEKNGKQLVKYTSFSEHGPQVTGLKGYRKPTDATMCI